MAAPGPPGDGEDKKGVNKLGLPTGFNYVPKDVELLDILDVKLSGRPLHPAHDAVFHEVRILDFHPAKLYEMYAKDEENGYIYFFNTREFPTSNKKWPLREAEDGTWRSTYGTKAVKSKNSGGLDVGQKQTLVFHQRFPGNKEPVRTNWSMHEFTRIIGPQNEVSDLAVYRLYKIRKNGKETPADLAADAAASMNKRSCTERGQASASMELPPPAPSMADQANVVSASQAYAPSQSGTYAYGAAATLRPGSSFAPPRAPGPTILAPLRAPEPSNSWAPPRAPWPSNSWAPPRAPGPSILAPPREPGSSSQAPPSTAERSSWVPPIAPVHSGHFAPMYLQPRLDQQPPIAAIPVDRKGKAPLHSTGYGGYVGSTSATELPAGRRNEDDCQREMEAMLERNTQQGSSSSSVAAASGPVLDISSFGEFYQLFFGLEEPSGAQIDATTPPAPPLEDGNDEGSAAGGSQPQGGASSGSHQQEPPAN